MRSSSGSRGLGPLCLGLSASLLLALTPNPSGQQERRDADQGRGVGWGSGPIVIPVESPGTFYFVPLAEVITPFVPHSSF